MHIAPHRCHNLHSALLYIFVLRSIYKITNWYKTQSINNTNVYLHFFTPFVLLNLKKEAVFAASFLFFWSASKLEALIWPMQTDTFDDTSFLLWGRKGLLWSVIHILIRSCPSPHHHTTHRYMLPHLEAGQYNYNLSCWPHRRSVEPDSFRERERERERILKWAFQ